MQQFTYRSGKRPLDGYTIKRGVGQGGFGEVYFAVSDGGKEVALKLLRGHSDVELRGVANCLNLKHPNLVHVYDLKVNEQGETWLIMEYVLGESLAQVIDRHPNGLPANLSREWFLSLCRAVGYLHDHGVVHRDLKPANIFIENGTLKVGDYGLCKSIQNRQSDRKQTKAVGTVHYMAPEISTGNYNKQIDVYACGVILQELLTGQPPFDGESEGEILMKHLTATADVSHVPMLYRPVVLKALDKNPIRRYSSMAELARAVESTSVQAIPVVPVVTPIPPETIPAAPNPPTHLANIVNAPAVDSAMPKPVTAQPVNEIQAANIKQTNPLESPQPITTAVPLALDQSAQHLAQARPVNSLAAIRDRISDLTGAFVKAPFLAVACVLPFGIAGNTDPFFLGKMALLGTLISWIFLLGSGRLSYRSPDSWWPRIRMGVLGILVGLLTFWFEGWPTPVVNPGEPIATGGTRLLGLFYFPGGGRSIAIDYMLYFGSLLAVGRWWRMAARDRKERFTMYPVMAAGIWGLVLSFLWPWSEAGNVWSGIIPVGIATIAVQLVSPWSPPPAQVVSKKIKYKQVA